MEIAHGRQAIWAALRRQSAPGLVVLFLLLLSAALDRVLLGLPLGLFSSKAEHPTLIHIAAVIFTYGLSALFFWLSLRAPYRCRILYLLGFTAAEFIEYGYVTATGITAGPSEIFIAFQDTVFWNGMSSVSIDWRAAVMAAVYALVLALYPSFRRRHFGQFVSLCSVTLVFHTASLGYRYEQSGQDLQLVAGARSNIETGTTQALTRAAINFAWFKILYYFTEQPKHLPVEFHAPLKPMSHIVLVIDESIRADHLSVNGYRRPTTPWLETLQKTGKLTNWGEASSSATSSFLSVSSILSGVALPDRERRIFRQPSIFQYASAMGYETHLFDGQMVRPVYASVLEDGEEYAMLTGKLRTIDDYADTKRFGRDWNTDFRIARAVHELLKRSNGQFIVILKRGNHIPYYHNYPPDNRKWAPRVVTGSLKHTYDPEVWSEWVDSYDDAIQYNLDGFFRILLEQDGSLPRTVVIYTSDHGVPYYPENDAQWRTASAVPLLMFGDLRPKVDTGYQPSHLNLFATLLDLMKYPENQRQFTYRRSLLFASASDNDQRSVFEGDDLDTAGIGHFASHDFDKLPATVTIR